MKDILIVFVSVSMSTIISTIFVYLNSKLQLKRDFFKNENNLKIQELNCKFKKLQLEKKRILNGIKKISIGLNNIFDCLSLTRSVIDSSEELSLNDFDRRYITERRELNTVLGEVVISMPDLYKEVKEVAGMLNLYWGYQRQILNSLNKQQNEYMFSQREIIINSDNVLRKINSIQDHLIEIVKDLPHLSIKSI